MGKHQVETTQLQGELGNGVGVAETQMSGNIRNASGSEGLGQLDFSF